MSVIFVEKNPSKRKKKKYLRKNLAEKIRRKKLSINFVENTIGIHTIGIHTIGIHTTGTKVTQKA